MLMALGSCSSPPQPPAVDPSHRRPVNATAAVDLQVCQGELQNTRIRTTETLRQAERASARARLAQQEAFANARSDDIGTHSVYTILFAFGSTEFKLSPPLAAQLVERARQAELVVTRGRTDGDVETPGESRVARERAAAVRAYLVQSGVDPARIRSTYQPVGDHVASNGTPAGRALNRRVEVELYSASPQLVALNDGRHR
jgi:outer membrane protein OmpA-like peptidoglycan-associated protein